MLLPLPCSLVTIYEPQVLVEQYPPSFIVQLSTSGVSTYPWNSSSLLIHTARSSKSRVVVMAMGEYDP